MGQSAPVRAKIPTKNPPAHSAEREGPHGAVSARLGQDPHKKPTTIPCRGNPARGHRGAATGRWALRLRGRDRARGYAG